MTSPSQLRGERDAFQLIVKVWVFGADFCGPSFANSIAGERSQCVASIPTFEINLNLSFLHEIQLFLCCFFRSIKFCNNMSIQHVVFVYLWSRRCVKTVNMCFFLLTFCWLVHGSFQKQTFASFSFLGWLKRYSGRVMQDTDTQLVVAAYPGVSQTRDPMGA